MLNIYSERTRGTERSERRAKQKPAVLISVNFYLLLLLLPLLLLLLLLLLICTRSLPK
jgi:hypothetical protein